MHGLETIVALNAPATSLATPRKIEVSVSQGITPADHRGLRNATEATLSLIVAHGTTKAIRMAARLELAGR